MAIEKFVASPLQNNIEMKELVAFWHQNDIKMTIE